MKILIVEDDDTTRELIKKSLSEENYELLDSGSPVAGLKILSTEKPEIIILDIILPEIDGLGVCQIVRKYPEKYGNPYILMLTAKKDEEDIVKGLESGADDYIKKPFSSKELIARLKAVSRRTSRTSEKITKYMNLLINSEKQIVTDENGNGIDLYKKEYDLLVYLVSNKGIILTRENIFENIWEGIFIPGDRTVDNYVWKLKTKIPAIAEHLKSVRGMGYKLDRE
jgi:DNA-binding response OmpR family regulator